MAIFVEYKFMLKECFVLSAAEPCWSWSCLCKRASERASERVGERKRAIESGRDDSRIVQSFAKLLLRVPITTYSFAHLEYLHKTYELLTVSLANLFNLKC